MNSLACEKCGNCCSFEIPVSILDIYKISLALDVDPVLVFVDYLEKDISKKTGLFKLKKNDSGECVFLNNEKQCNIHDYKPNVCRFYDCHKEKKTWMNSCIDNAQKMSIWEHSIASQLSKNYISKSGTKWSEHEFSNCLSAILDNIVTKPKQKFKTGRTENNQLIGVVYDCDSCSQRGCVADETIITIDDINRIINFLEIELDDFFKSYMEQELSKQSKIFKLKREKRCVFFDEKLHCTINSVKPMHCRFTSCPKKVKNPEIYTCLYLGAGTIDEQFRHQVAISYTKKFIQNKELLNSSSFFNAYINKIEEVVELKIGLEDFCNDISKYRFIDDSWTILQMDEKN